MPYESQQISCWQHISGQVVVSSHPLSTLATARFPSPCPVTCVEIVDASTDSTNFPGTLRSEIGLQLLFSSVSISSSDKFMFITQGVMVNVVLSSVGIWQFVGQVNRLPYLKNVDLPTIELCKLCANHIWYFSLWLVFLVIIKFSSNFTFKIVMCNIKEVFLAISAYIIIFSTMAKEDTINAFTEWRKQNFVGRKRLTTVIKKVLNHLVF